MKEHKYKIVAKDGELFCYKDGVAVEDWDILKGERMPAHKLFVNGVGVATLDAIEWEGIDATAIINGFTGEVANPILAVSNERTVDPNTGEITFKAVRPNGDIAITVLDKDYRIIEEKCKVIKAAAE